MFRFKISFRLLPWSSRRCTRASSTGRDVPSRATLAITSKRFFTTSFPFTARWNGRRHQLTLPSWIGSCFDSSNPYVKRSIDFSAAFPGWTPMAAFRYILQNNTVGKVSGYFYSPKGESLDALALTAFLFPQSCARMHVTEKGKPEVVSNGTGPLACLSLFPVAGLDKVS